MKQLAIITFIIENEEQKPKDPEVLREAFSKIQLFSALSGTNKYVFNFDDNTFAGTFNADNQVVLAEELLDASINIFKDLGLKGRILVSIGEQWVWRATIVKDKG